MDFTLYDHLQNPLIAVNQDGKIEYYNNICSTYFKLPPRKLNKLEKVDELIFAKDFDIFGHIRKALEIESPVVSRELEISSEVSRMTVILKFIPIAKNLVAIHLLDFSIEKQLHEKYKEQILELKNTHEQILMSDKITALGELTAGISHEISTPLTIVSNRLMSMNHVIAYGDKKMMQEHLSDVQKEFNRIRQIISGMQSFVKNQEDQLFVCDLSQIIDNSINFIKELGILGAVDLKSTASGQHLAMANDVKLQQVLINLVKNAIDALKETTSPAIEIRLEVDEEDQRYIIEIADNGPGVPSEIKENIFDMFFTSKELGEGTGLGLAISKKIIESHHGKLALKENTKGCTFQIQLPLIEVGSFTQTNKYLRGEGEIEGEKLCIFSDRSEYFNLALEVLKDKDYVLIFSNKLENLEDMVDFYMADRILCLMKQNIDDLEDIEVKNCCEIKDLAELKEFLQKNY